MRSDDFWTIIKALEEPMQCVFRGNTGKCDPMFFGYYQSSRSSICVSRKHPGNCDPMIFGYYERSRSSICVSKKHLPVATEASFIAAEERDFRFLDFDKVAILMLPTWSSLSIYSISISYDFIVEIHKKLQ